MDSTTESLQDRYAPNDKCFGCGPANERGLRIKSRVMGDELLADWTPEPHHEAFPGILNGGIIGALLDCHSNWAAAWAFMKHNHSDTPPCTVTASFHVRLHRPTPSKEALRLRARVVEQSGDRATVEATLEARGVLTASCRGVFVAVKEDHPAYRRFHGP
jgi:acyl-coenzyme A thioesterase PaaI-like protein